MKINIIYLLKTEREILTHVSSYQVVSEIQVKVQFIVIESLKQKLTKRDDFPRII